MGKLIALALRFRFLVLLCTAMVIVMGLFSMKELPIDAVPDVTPNQVLVLTKARGLSPLEVEQLLTFPVESAMTGLPGITQIQSVKGAVFSNRVFHGQAVKFQPIEIGAQCVEVFSAQGEWQDGRFVCPENPLKIGIAGWREFYQRVPRLLQNS